MDTRPGNPPSETAIAADLAPGSQVGPYVVIATLGRGGMGQVLLAHDARLQRKVALKRLLSDAGTPAVHARILREARAAARINHPNVATVHDVVEHGEHTFIVMEYVEGESLASRLARGPLPPATTIAIGRQIANGLAAAHAQGVVHRDLKPANIQLTPSGAIKILDFGVARVPIAGGAGADETTTSAISEGGQGGTPAYMAPEQLLGGPVDHRADIYGAGVVLYEMAVGHRPYPARDGFSLMLAMARGDAPDARDGAATVPAWLSQVINTALARDPANRFESADALARALETEGTTAEETRPPSSRRRRAVLGSIAAVVATVVGIAVAPSAIGRFGGGGPFVIAVLPIENPGANPLLEQAAWNLESTLTANLRATPGVAVVSGGTVASAPRGELATFQRDIGATHVVDLKLTASGPQMHVSGRVRSKRTGDVWSPAITGDEWSVERQVLDGLAATLQNARPWRGGLPSAARARLTKLPTSNAAALDQYSEARTLMDRPDIAANIRRAVDLLSSAVALDPQFAVALAALADAYCQQYQRTKDSQLIAAATERVNVAMRLDPESGRVYYSLGNLQNTTGRRDDAVQSLRRAIQLDPAYDEPRRLLGLILADRGELEAGIAEAQRAIEIRPRSWSDRNTLGFIYYNAARYAEAAREFRGVTELQPTLPRGYLMLGAALHKAGDIPQAIGNYQHAVRLGPTPSAYSNLGVIYYTSGRLPEAVQAFQAAADGDPASAVYRRNLGDAALKNNERGRAREAYARCVELGNRQLAVNARDSATIALIALCEAKLGRRRDAERHASEALALAPTDREILYKNAAIAALFRDRARALGRLREALERGYQPSLVRDDDDFAGLRTVPEFQRLVGAAQ